MGQGLNLHCNKSRHNIIVTRAVSVFFLVACSLRAGLITTKKGKN